ncbi:MAG: EAL domain-containing protein [Sulfuricurvum sp.]|nr:EAL domain-containing protein [Sulfuricurvum sp.]
MINTKFKNAKLSTKIITALFISGIIIFGAISFITINIVRDFTLKGQKEKASLLINTVETPISVALFLGTNGLKEKVLPIIRLKEVYALNITDNDGSVVFDYHKEHSLQTDTSIQVSKALYEPSSRQKIGTITLSYSGEEFMNTMEQFYQLYILLLLIAAVILWIILEWINRLLLPIKLLAQKVHNFRPGEKIIFDIPYKQKEFGQIIQAFNSMQDRVWAYADKFQTVNKNLENKVAEQTKEALRHLYYDSMTTLPNRLKLQEDFSDAPRHTIAIINIDDFKEINDFFGIEEGDTLLIQIAHWLEELKLNPYRIGGDEFAFKIPDGPTQEDFHREAELILTMLSEKVFIIGEETVHVRGTIGIAIDSDKPLIHADVALNRARLLHKPYSVYNQSEGIEQQYRNNIAMSSHIRQALLEHRIVCQYQPILSCTTGKIEKYETLVRIKNPDGSLIGPNDFLFISQKTKLYHHITQEVVYQACHQFAGRHEQFSINLSGSDIIDQKTINIIESTLMQTGTANRVIFEILESEGIENFEVVNLFINRMKALGAKIAIDDFGTGYSNFENILQLNVDFLKIDGSLIKSIHENPRHRIVVEAIVDFAKRIGVETVAEFVSSQEILATVSSLGITYSQGFYTGKPQFFENASV